MFTILDGLLIFLILAYLKKRKRSPLQVLVYAWNPLVILEFSGSGHLDSLMLLLWGLSLYYWDQNSDIKAGMALGAAVMAKFIPLVMLPLMVIQRRWRMLFTLIATMGILVVPYYSEPLFSSRPLSGLSSFAKDWVFNPSFYAIFKIGIPHPFWLKLFLGLVLMGGVVYGARRFKDEILLYAMGVVVALLFFSPVVHPWYVTWIIPFLCFYRFYSLLLWTFLVGLTYVVQIQYVREGIWHLPAWVGILEYGLLWMAIAVEMFGAFHRRNISVMVSDRKNRPQKLFFVGGVNIVIPVLNEEKSIELVLNDIPKPLVSRVIVVDNGSTDNTAAVAARLGAVVVSEPRRGYGQAVQTGLRYLSEDCQTVVVMDGDYSDYPQDLTALLTPVLKGEADMVIGNRTDLALSGSLMPQQRFGNWLSATAIRYLYGFQFSDMGPFRAIRRDVLMSLDMEDLNFGWNVEMQVKALQQGIRIKEIPVRYRPRLGQSKISGTMRGSFQAGRIILWALWHYGVIWGCNKPSER